MRSRRVRKPKGLPKDRACLPNTILVTMLIGPLVHATGAFAALDLALPLALRITGLMLAALSLLPLNAAYRDLGPSWDQVPSVPCRLVTFGVYAHVRHPIYSAALLWCLGQGLGIPNLLVGAILPGLLALLLLERAKEEEQLLCRAYGQAYRRYMQRVPRFIPRLWGGSG